MIKQLSIVAIIASVLLLAGCQQNAFGVSQKQFAAMTPEQKSHTISKYNAERKNAALQLPLHVVAGTDRHSKKR